MSSSGSCIAKRIYQLKIHLLGVSPMVWRRVLVHEDSSIAELHGVLQITMGWENQHLHCFRIFGKQYGISYAGGMEFQNDARKVVLSDLGLRVKDVFFYDYDFYADWRHHIRVEKVLEPEAGTYYPKCIAGENACPPENISDIETFTEIRELYDSPFYTLFKIIHFQEDVGYAWRPDNFKKKIINSLLRKTDYRCLGQNDPFFPDRGSLYFKDEF